MALDTTIAAAVPRAVNGALHIYPTDNQLEISFCIDRDYERCTTLLLHADECTTLPDELNDATRSIMMPTGGGCKLYKGKRCNDNTDGFRSWRPKSVPDLRSCSFLGCWKGMELGVSSVRCKFT